MESSVPRITIGYTYYEEPELLEQQIKLWEKYPHEVEIVLVDDGSSLFPAKKILDKYKLSFDLKLYAVDEDLGFNSHGCRNLIATVASSDTILFLDIDCSLNPNDVAYIRTVSFNKESVYTFFMYETHSYTFKFMKHVNVFIVNKEKFWEAGGYDESFTGWHHGDREFKERLLSITKEKFLGTISCNLCRGSRKLILDENATTTKHDNSNHSLILPAYKEKTYAEMRGTVKTKLNFSYTQVL